MSFKYFLKQLPRNLGILLIRIYQWFLSPMLGSCCRFFPSCSHYALQALQIHGFVQGFWLSIKRVSKCGPWHPGGLDLVPKTTLEAAVEPYQEVDDHF
ncbi:membrane protein insertion efficiency factor YidD [Candidatus Chlamydia sanziniae]|uniref:membrane protein insertion efficiency factor YidD n=1 Tax=Candidatus Chlamydia sanziniae TaxID=1806891 RepID=UPI0009EF4BB9|nr:membrane protein insertion efficiency factor YidD [Candidatus Chlamydia sanziniae]